MRWLVICFRGRALGGPGAFLFGGKDWRFCILGEGVFGYLSNEFANFGVVPGLTFFVHS
ncbi:hypothetical protein BN2127_JRS10_00105 [Bacillus subtilis]|nr:hypothetical protein BN2127_JRS10_00105 [Bacillus subtilis]